MADSRDSTTLILVRHGETGWNRIKRIQGQIDIALSPLGARQAALLAERIAMERMAAPDRGGASGAFAASVAPGAPMTSAAEASMTSAVERPMTSAAGRPMASAVETPMTSPAEASMLPGRAPLAYAPPALGRIDAVVSSDLQRAMRTAEPIARAAGVEVIADAGLRERHYGVFQGHDAAAIAARWPQAHARWIAHDPDFAPEGGESLRALSARVVSALDAIAARHPGRTVVCVAHGGVLDCAYRFATALPLTRPRDCLLLNASVNRIVWSGGGADGPRARVLAWADIAHLARLVDSRDDD